MGDLKFPSLSFIFALVQDKTVALETSPAQPAEEELNPFLIFPQPEENFKVPNSLVCFYLFFFF